MKEELINVALTNKIISITKKNTLGLYWERENVSIKRIKLKLVLFHIF
jgi:hypothetical protein